jgi:hypothetical protein
VLAPCEVVVGAVKAEHQLPTQMFIHGRTFQQADWISLAPPLARGIHRTDEKAKA